MGAQQSLCKRKTSDQIGGTSISTQTSLPKQKMFSSEINKSHFKILRVIGRGSFGKVFLVQKKDTKELFAMKVLKKENVFLRNQIEHTKSEREILQKIASPFIMKMHYAFQTPDKLYMVMDFMNGGELFFHLRKEKQFNEDRIRFYSAEIILALQCLHASGIIYRDLKPENILLDADGHIRLTDFGLSKQGIFRENQDKTFTICGTPEYLAPEIIRCEGHGKSVDWWSLGTMMYEMFTGTPPFTNPNKMKLLYTIATTGVDFEKISHASAEFQDLIKKLLTYKQEQRLGSQENGVEEIKNHPFFKGVDWDKFANKEIPPLFKPECSSEFEVNNIDKIFLREKPIDSPVVSRLNDKQKQMIYFEEFTYNKDTVFKMETEES